LKEEDMKRGLQGIVLIIGLIMLASCTPTSVGQQPGIALLEGGTLAAIDPATVGGPLEITGSSTVYPLTTRITEEFAAAGSPAEIDIKFTGTGGGFRSFCNGDPVDIVNASRAINDREIAACRAVGREPIGFPVGIDALAVVVHPQNTFVQSLSFTQLAAIFSGTARSWRDVDPTYPDQPIAVFSPGVDSGTFDYFVETIFAGDESQIPATPGVVLSEDDTELVRGIEERPNAIGYFGYAYFQREGERLRAIPIDSGAGPVAPGAETVGNNTYPLARPLFIYTSIDQLKTNTTTAAFMSYYLQTASDVVAEVGYFPIADTLRNEAQQQLVAALQ
jgi:phosphate transport system substrate-binding protein